MADLQFERASPPYAHRWATPERRRGTLEGVPGNKLDGAPNAWDGVSVALILRFYPERVETKMSSGLSILKDRTTLRVAPSLADHPVGAQDERFRDGDARCFCGLETAATMVARIAIAFMAAYFFLCLRLTCSTRNTSAAIRESS
jgi:hypothetical protein